MRTQVRGAAAFAFALAACGGPPPAPDVDALRVHDAPGPAPGGAAFTLTLTGAHLADVTKVEVGPHALTPRAPRAQALVVDVPPLPRGPYPVTASSPAGASPPLTLEVGNSAPIIELPGPQRVLPGEALSLELELSDFDGDPVLLEPRDAPAGLEVPPLSGRLELTPGPELAGQHLRVRVSASDGLEHTELELTIEVLRAPPPMHLEALAPALGPGGRAFELEVLGRGFTPGAEVRFEGVPVPTAWRDATRLAAAIPASARGRYSVEVARGDERTRALALEVKNTPPRLVLPPPASIPEREEATSRIRAEDLEGDPVQVFLRDLPPGAQFDPAEGALRFRPDFTQGGQRFRVRALASDGRDVTEASFWVAVQDTVRPPWPTVVKTEDGGDHLRLVLEQRTDDFLDSPGHAGRSFEARVSVPIAASAQHPLPVRVYLHGFGGAPYRGGRPDQFRIYPHDPENTYWWGYSAEAPRGVEPGPVPPYTARRVLHLVEWLLRRYPGADPEQVYLTGTSMGGAGAAAIGLLWARHFALVEAQIGQKVARNHRPSRIAQLSLHWGAPQDSLLDDRGIPVWDRLDLVRALAELPEARHQWIFSRHAKDDPIIHFGAAVIDSPLVGASWLEALQAYRVGHLAVWDEGAHGPPDPVMGKGWWDGGHDPIFDEITFLRRNLAFVAFTNSALDDEPGDGSGNGRQPWDEESGYAGALEEPGDTGWGGDPAGAFNRYLRWDARRIVDEVDVFSVPLRLHRGEGAPPPRPGYPPRGDRYTGPLPVHADVTPRRAQAFLPRPGERIRWRYGARSGELSAAPDGSVTVPAVALGEDWVVLELTRDL